MKSSRSSHLWQLVVLLTVALAAFSVFGGTASAEIDDQPLNNFWGVTGLDNGVTLVDSQVWAIEQIDNVIYVGGMFTEVKGGSTTYPQSYLAAFHADTGRWIDWWRPTFDAPVYNLQASPDGSRLFVGGEFTTVNGVNRKAFTALDPVTADIDFSWPTSVSGGAPAIVRAFDLVGNDLYIAGAYTTIAFNGAQEPASKVARVNVNTGVIDQGFKPQVNGGGIWGVAASPVMDRVYITGYFDDVNGDTSRSDAAVLNGTTGAPVPGMLHIHQTASVNYRYQQDVVWADNKVFIGGSQHNVHVYDEATFELLHTHMTRNGGDIQDMEVSPDGQRVYVSCHCWNFNYEYEELQTWSTPHPNSTQHAVRGVFAIDATTGHHDPNFSVDMTGQAGPWGIHVNASDGCLWVGGDMTTADNGTPVNSLVRMCDSNGPGPAAGPQLTPPAPTACAATLNGTDVDLTWDTVDYASEYVVFRNGSWAGAVSDPGTTWTDTNTQIGPSYTYTVATRSGNVLSNPPVTCSPTINLAEAFAPVAPATCTVTETAGGDVSVDWVRAANDNATNFIVYRSRNGGTFGWAANVAVPGVSFTDTNVSLNNTYAYEVLTRNGNVSAATRTACGSVSLVPAGPVAPATCTVTETAGGDVAVDWVRSANDNATNFIVYRSRNGGAFSWRANVAAPGVSFTDSNVSLNNTYAYEVLTRNGSASAPTRTACGSVSLVPAGPVAPATCTVTETAGGDVAVNWVRAGNDNATNFIVYRSRNGGAFSWAANVATPGVSFTDTNVSLNNTYAYEVLTRNGTASAPTRTACGSVTLAAAGPVPVTSCSVTETAGGDVQVDWVRAANDNATNFIVFRSRNGGAHGWAGNVAAPGTGFLNTTVSSGSTYNYEIEVRNGSAAAATRTNCGSVAVGANTLPVAVTSCSVTNVAGNGQVDWVRAANDNADAFIIFRSKNGGASSWAARVNLPAASTWTDTNVAAGNTYTYSVVTKAGTASSASTVCTPDLVLAGGL